MALAYHHLVATMTHAELVFEALAYRRNVGATPADLRPYVMVLETSAHSSADDVAALRELETAGAAMKIGTRWYLTDVGLAQATGRALEAEWQNEDAWILLAITYSSGAGGAATLDQVVGAADMINHALPTVDEVHGAVNRLLTARLIAVKNGHFSTTARARDLLAKVRKSTRKGVMAVWRGLTRILVCPCCGIRLKAVRWKVIIDGSLLNAAEKKYFKGIKGS